jgi:hypothetical protein
LSDPAAVTLLYTANVGGDLRLLSRLFTLIRAQRADNTLSLLFDLGDTCALESWVCRATQGRAPFLVLDAMGYDLALVGATERVSIPPASLRLLLGQIMLCVMIWNRPRQVSRRALTVHLATGEVELPEGQPGLRIDRTADMLPELNTPVPVLGDVAQGCLARVDMAWPAWTVQSTRLLELTPGTPPDPTISAVVDLVESEARTYTQQQGGTE